MDSSVAIQLDTRAKGQFPVSIATSLAVEGAFGMMLENQPTKNPSVYDYQEIWFNLRTMFRNFYGSLQKEHIDRLMPEHIGEALREEMTILRGVLEQQSTNRIKAVFYVCNYDSLTRLHKFAIFKEVKTDKQKFYAGLENATMNYLIEHHGEEFGIRNLDTQIVGNGKDAIMLTHYPFDLLSNVSFGKLALLESHTGVIKTPALWYTKLNNGKELSRIPFNMMTIQLFGDSGGLLAPYSHAEREAIMKIAEKHKWNPTTTKERIIFTVGLEKMPLLEALVKKLFVL